MGKKSQLKNLQLSQKERIQASKIKAEQEAEEQKRRNALVLKYTAEQLIALTGVIRET